MEARWKESGFTLVEMIIVIILISIISFIALPSMSSFFKISLRSITREVAGNVREAYNSTVITGQVHRLAYDIKEGQFWVESGPSDILLDSEESKQIDEKNKRLISTKDTKKKSRFKLETSITKSKITLPRGVTFEDIYTEQSKDPIKEGIAYTHFFPHGLAEQTLIHLADNSDHKISLLITPLIGKTRVMEGYVDAEQVFGKTKR